MGSFTRNSEGVVHTSIRLYSTEFEIQLYLGDDVSGLTVFIQAIQQTLHALGYAVLAPTGGNRVLIVAFDASGRTAGWFESDHGRPGDIPTGLEDDILSGVTPPNLKGGVIVFGIHYSYATQDPDFKRDWAPTPEAWAIAAGQIDGEVDLGMVASRILSTKPPQKPHEPDAALSTAIDDCLSRGTGDSYAAFVETFGRSTVGAFVQPAPPERAHVADRVGNPIDLGALPTPDGRSLVVLFADPWEFAPRFGLQFNGTVHGSGVLTLLNGAPSHPGVVVSSATVERSLQVTPQLVHDLGS